MTFKSSALINPTAKINIFFRGNLVMHKTNKSVFIVLEDRGNSDLEIDFYGARVYLGLNNQPLREHLDDLKMAHFVQFNGEITLSNADDLVEEPEEIFSGLEEAYDAPPLAPEVPF